MHPFDFTDSDFDAIAPQAKPRRSSIYAGAERVAVKSFSREEEADDEDDVEYLQKLQASMQGYFKNKLLNQPAPAATVCIYHLNSINS